MKDCPMPETEQSDVEKIRELNRRAAAEKPARCAQCGRPILFLLTAAGKRMPCDPPLQTVLTSDGQVRRGLAPHFATCPTRRPQR